MSNEANERLLCHSKHNGNNRNVLSVLAYRTNSTTMVCFPGIADIAAKASVSERTVQRCLRELCASGELYAPAVAGRHRVTLYFITAGLNQETIENVLIEHYGMHPTLEARPVALDILEKQAVFYKQIEEKAASRKGANKRQKVTIEEKEKVTELAQMVTTEETMVTDSARKGDTAMSPEQEYNRKRTGKNRGAATPTPAQSALPGFDTTALTPESGDMKEDAEQTNCDNILDATPKQDATSKRVASKNKQKVAKADKPIKAKDETLDYPTSEIYRRVFGPNMTLAQRIRAHEDVGESEDKLKAFDDACQLWALQGYNPRNVMGILEYCQAQKSIASERMQRANGNGYNHSGVTARNTTNNRNGYSRNVEPVEHYGEDESLRRASELVLERQMIEQRIAAERQRKLAAQVKA